MESRLIRLSKLLSERGICSRREADVYIEAGQVLVDGEVVSQLGTKVSPDVSVELLDSAKEKQKQKITIILNKPVGFVSTQPEKGYVAAITLIRKENQDKRQKKLSFSSFRLNKLSVCGRLDIDSKGLLVFTQDGVIAKQLIGSDSSVEKEYIVRVEGEITSDALSGLSHGLMLDDKVLKKAKVEKVKDGLLRIILKEGKKRQIRRMCELVGLKVISLKRVRVGKILLGELPLGNWRYLKPGEEF